MAKIPNLGARLRLTALLLAGASLAACASVEPRYPNHAAGAPKPPAAGGQGVYKVGSPYQVGGVWYVPREQPDYDETGIASWYGDEFHEKATANGEIFDMNAVSAAHTTLPMPSIVEVTNLDNGRSLQVRVNDRGPFVGGRIIDLSHEAARQLGYDRAGLARVRVRYVGPAPLLTNDAGVRYAQAKPLPTRLAATAVSSAGAASAGGAAAGRAARAAPATGATVLADQGVSDPVMELAAGSPRAAAAQRAVGAIDAQPLPPVTGAAISASPIPPAVKTVAPPEPVSQAELAPLPTAPRSAPDPLDAGAQATLSPAPRAMVAQASGLAASRTMRIQCGAFSSEANAQRAVSQLAAAGQAQIEPLQRPDGVTLYRVVLPAPDDEAAAYALRDRVAQIGFADARVVHSF